MKLGTRGSAILDLILINKDKMIKGVEVLGMLERVTMSYQNLPNAGTSD